MEDIILAKSYLLENDVNFVLARDNQILVESSARGIEPIFQWYKENKDYFKGGTVADRVIGKAASIFLINGGIKSLYAVLISDIAYEYLTDNGIEVEYSKRVPMILNRTKDDICPMEKLSSGVESVDELMSRIEKFFKLLDKKEKI
jgi:hypothetical protein